MLAGERDDGSEQGVESVVHKVLHHAIGGPERWSGEWRSFRPACVGGEFRSHRGRVQVVMSACVLSLDLGTTAVKASVVEEAPVLRVIASSSADTAAHLPLADARLREQDVGRILAGVEAVTSALDHTALRRCRRIAIADQMHGVVAFARSSPGTTRTPLVTWEDQRVPAAVLGTLNDRLRAAGLPPMFSGYGWATMAAPAVEASPFHRLLPDCDAACTVGAYLAHVLTASTAGVWMDATDCASLGCYDAAAGRVRADLLRDPAAGSGGGGALARFVPTAVAAPGTACGLLDRDAAAALGLPTIASVVGTGACAGSTAAAPVTVHCSVGDHPASVAGAMVLLRQQLGGAADAAAAAAAAEPAAAAACPTVLINVGTSAQAAALGVAEVLTAVGIALPAGCEVRPAIRLDAVAPPLPTTAASDATAYDAPESAGAAGGAAPPSPLMLVAASMNGGNVLAFIAARLAVFRRRLQGAADRAAFSLADAYAVLEERALPLLSSAVGAGGTPLPLARVGGRCLPVIAGKHMVLPTLVPERRAVYATVPDASSGGAGAACWTDAMTAVASVVGSGGASSAAVDDAAIKVWSLAELSPSLFAPDALDTLAAVYAGAAASIVFSVCSMLPAAAWAQAGRIVLTGAAFGKSKVLLAATNALLPMLQQAAVTAAAAALPTTALAVPAAAAADKPPLPLARPPPAVHVLSVEEMQSAGALGAAAAALAAAGGA